MKTLAVISQKGGIGKTTLATGLAVSAYLNGQSAAVFDLDPQASAAFWKDTRAQDAPAVLSLQPSRLPHLLKAAAEAGTDLAIIDAPSFAKDVAFEAAQMADFILIPTKPAVLDVMAMTKTLELVSHHRKPSAVVLTFCPHQGAEIEDTEAAVRALGSQVAPVRVHTRIAYSRAQQTGLSAQEFEPGGKAADELTRLYKYICMNLWDEDTDGRPAKKRAASRS